MVKYKYVLFDWDGCLADTLSIWLKAYKQVFNYFGVQVSDQQIVLEAFGDWRASGKFGIEDAELFNRLLVENVEEAMKDVVLNGEVGWLLEKLKTKGVKIAIVTSSVKKLVWPAIKRYKLNDLIDVFLTGEDVSEHKPHPEMVEVAIERLGGKKAESVIVGDSDKDVGAGKGAGIDTLVYYPKANRHIYAIEIVHALGADGVAKDISDLWVLLADSNQ